MIFQRIVWPTEIYVPILSCKIIEFSIYSQGINSADHVYKTKATLLLKERMDFVKLRKDKGKLVAFKIRLNLINF